MVFHTMRFPVISSYRFVFEELYQWHNDARYYHNAHSGLCQLLTLDIVTGIVLHEGEEMIVH